MATMAAQCDGVDDLREDRESAQVRAAQHDPRAFAPLYDAYASPIYGYCLRLLRDANAAADATSETFLKALRALPSYRARSFRSWIFTIAHHVVIDMTRRRKPMIGLDAVNEPMDHQPTPEEQYLTQEANGRVAELLTRLRGKQRQVMELRMAGLETQEIADVLQCEVGSVRTAQSRALTRLRQIIKTPAPQLIEEGRDDAH